MTVDLKALAAEFPKEAIHWRAQSLTKKGDKALALAYLDARDVMDRLDEVCGPANWQSKYSETARGRVLCSLGIRIGDEWIWKTDGAGNTAVEAEKGGISDALKRTAVSWGIGRYLYRIKSPWVPCKTYNGKFDDWTASPWNFVRSAPTYVQSKPSDEADPDEPQGAAPEPEAPKPERDPVAIAASLVAMFKGAALLPRVKEIRESDKVKDARAWLAEHHPNHAEQVAKAETAALARVDPAMQRPADDKAA